MSREVAIDLWICDHYNVLPTDERFKRLTDRQKHLLFQGFVELPNHDSMRQAYQESHTDRFTAADESNLKRMGYSEEQLKRIKDQLSKAGIASG